jgi:hypothetical protein
MIAAAAVMTLAVDDRPCTTAPLLSPVRSYSSRMDESRKTLEVFQRLERESAELEKKRRASGISR